jgi:small subunit ribosomal protein S16
MLAIRLKRTGRKGHAQFRVVVQDSHRHPSSGKVVAYLGSYDPHSKVTQLDTEKASHFLSNGAQPSNRVARMLEQNGVTLPSWVKVSSTSNGKLRNPDKLRRNQPKEEAAPEAPAETADIPEEVVTETTAETSAEAATEESAAESTPEATTEEKS